VARGALRVFIPERYAPNDHLNNVATAAAASEYESADQDFVDAISVDWSDEGTSAE
jgi:hypothetical protein